MRPARDSLLVLVGGALGGGLRFALTGPDGPVWVVLVINVTGSFALAVLLLAVAPRGPDWLRPAIGTGFLGGYTTFSAMSVAGLGGGIGGVGLLLAGLATAVVGAALGAVVALRIAPAEPT